MIYSIKKLKNFGIYEDFSWDKTVLPKFSKFNLIYGWNRSGKTTISRVFSSCEKKMLFDEEKFKQYPENGEYELELADGTSIKSSNVISNTASIKVFNQDFIDENIFFQPGSTNCIPIVYVSDEDIKTKQQLEKDVEDRKKTQEELDQLNKQHRILLDSKNNFLTGLGREISNLLFDKTYNRTKIESKLGALDFNNLKKYTLTEADKQKYKILSRSESAGELLTTIKRYESFAFKIHFEAIKKLISKQIISQLLERLKNKHDSDHGLDEDLNAWAKQGFELHKQRNVLDKCLFCDSAISGDVFQNLAKHFSQDYEQLQNSIESQILLLKVRKLDLFNSGNTQIHPDFKTKFTTLTKELNDLILSQNKWIDGTIAILEQKIKNPFDPDLVEMLDECEEFRDEINKKIDEINEIIKEHNQKIASHESDVKSIRELLELDAIASALITYDFAKKEQEVLDLSKIQKSKAELEDKLGLEIARLQKQTSNIGLAINKINGHLHKFFGGDEIQLELSDDKKGYVIKRGKVTAKNLSEGEKTAIALAYFIVKVEENNFNLSDGVIFIDDPISSLDSNFIYHCYAIISSHFSKAKQLFISTHNFQLFNLMKDWLLDKNSHTSRDNFKLKSQGKPLKDMPCCFYMVENYLNGKTRRARIVELDETLRKYKSEYHFLFSLLKKFQLSDPSYADFYTIGNVSRRFFEIFADFKVPDSRDQRQKMEFIVNEANTNLSGNDVISEQDWLKAFKLINEFSHNHDPMSTIEHKDKTESGKAVEILLDIVKKADEKHYQILESSISS